MVLRCTRAKAPLLIFLLVFLYCGQIFFVILFAVILLIVGLIDSLLSLITTRGAGLFKEVKITQGYCKICLHIGKRG